jgi:hypothetical protein
MQRVHIDELDVHPEQGDCCCIRGVPFTGVAFDMWTNTIPKAEWTLREGMLWGPQRTWGPEGNPSRAWCAVSGLTHGVYRQWFRSGPLLKLALCRYGCTVRERTWDEQGYVIEDYTMPQGGREEEEMRRWEDRFRDAVQAEDIPAEFRDVAEGALDGRSGGNSAGAARDPAS